MQKRTRNQSVHRGTAPRPPQVTPPPELPPASPRKAVIIVLLVVVVLVLSGRREHVQPRSRRARAGQRNGYRFRPHRRRWFIPWRKSPTKNWCCPHRLQAYEESPIYARTNGYLLRWYKDIGSRVNKGELLADIDTPEVDQELSQARATRQQIVAATGSGENFRRSLAESAQDRLRFAAGNRHADRAPTSRPSPTWPRPTPTFAASSSWNRSSMCTPRFPACWSSAMLIPERSSTPVGWDGTVHPCQG